MNLPKRKVIIEFKTPFGDKRLDGIEVKFNIKKRMGSIMNEATIDICNLTREDINFLTSYTSQFIELSKRKRVRLYAGYEESGISLIFDGDIVEALPSNPPDVFLKCKALTGYYSNKDPVSITYDGDKTVKDICENAAALLSLNLKFESNIVKKIQDFSFTGDKTKIIHELNEIGGMVAYEDDGDLVVLDKNKPLQQVGIKNISEKSGMIGIPKPDSLGIEVTTLLDNKIKIGQQIYLESKFIPTCNGSYYIYQLEHEGDLRGTDFYTKIKARRL